MMDVGSGTPSFDYRRYFDDCFSYKNDYSFALVVNIYLHVHISIT